MSRPIGGRFHGRFRDDCRFVPQRPSIFGDPYEEARQGSPRFGFGQAAGHAAATEILLFRSFPQIFQHAIARAMNVPYR